MDDRVRRLEEQLAYLQRHVEQQDRVVLNLARELERMRQRVERLESKPSDEGDGSAGSPADERPPHW